MLARDDNNYLTLIGDMRTLEFDYLTRKGNAPIKAPPLGALENGLRANPNSLALLERLAGLTGMRHFRPLTPIMAAGLAGMGAAPPFRPADSLERQRLSRGRHRAQNAGGLAKERRKYAANQLRMGMDAFDRGDMKAAKMYWDSALAKKDNSPTLFNNYAVLLCETSPGDMKKAVSIYRTRPWKRYPTIPISVIRGHIYFKLGEYVKAPAMTCCSSWNLRRATRNSIASSLKFTPTWKCPTWRVNTRSLRKNMAPKQSPPRPLTLIRSQRSEVRGHRL